MLKKLITFLLIISVNAFSIAPHKKIIYPKRLTPIVINLDSKFPIFNEINDNMSTAMVKLLSNTLPQFDSISHIVLNTNNQLILLWFYCLVNSRRKIPKLSIVFFYQFSL